MQELPIKMLTCEFFFFCEAIIESKPEHGDHGSQTQSRSQLGPLFFAEFYKRGSVKC